MKHSSTLLIIALSATSTHAAILAPDDPSVSGSLGLWLTEAENNFDGTTWSDSSGNGNNASPVGLVDTVSPVTYAAPTIDLVTTTSDHNSSSVVFAGAADDLLVANDIFGGAGTNSLTIFVAYHVLSIGGNPNLTRPAGIGSVAGTQTNPGDHFNLASDPSVRKDNGQIGSGTYGAAAPVGSPFIRIARMDGDGVDEWFNTSAVLNSVLTDAGTQFTTSSDDFFLGDLRAGSTSVPGFASVSTSEFAISQVIVFDSALTDSQIADINEWMVTPIPEPGTTALLGCAALGLLRRKR